MSEAVMCIFYVVQGLWEAPWPQFPARAIFQDETEARSYLALVDIDWLELRRIAVSVTAGHQEDLVTKQW